ncbi:PASTA domain-containing protein [Puniceibacterium sediminis]|uniref:PASTA domain-containing protein n=1 Tax=Puniceibacterium sediminis TaxID=1608407 RepID=A0A238WIK6_9RHOB|nr:PASTA domain-containing protein [Puniceibacterium sediminis]SNR46395.1 PASTA domain-containing protein [Puniceibacterium sediminis]
MKQTFIIAFAAVLLGACVPQETPRQPPAVPADTAASETLVIMPDVVGLGSGQAVSILRNLDPQMAIGLARSTNDAPKDTVFKQDPAPGVEIVEGRLVVLSVSKGPASQPIFVPALIGEKYSVATRQLGKLKIPYTHVAGSLEEGSRPLNLCESKVWYPVVESISPPAGTEWREGRTPLRITTKKKTEYRSFPPPAGRICP